MQKLSSAAFVPFEDRISSYYKKHQEHIHLFLFLFVVNIFVYGQRLVGFILAPDDVWRMMVGGVLQSTFNKRWFNELIGTTILGGERHILLFFNSTISVFSVTLAGFITAFLFEAKRKTHIAVITLLCSTVPAWGFQLYFSTNAIVFASTAWGVYGVYALYRYKTVGKIIGFILIVCAVGTYQSIIMVALAIVCIRTMVQCIRAEAGKEMLRAVLGMFIAMGIIGLAYGASNAINSAAVSLMGTRVDVFDYMKTRVPRTAADVLATIAAVVSNATAVYSLFYEKTYLLLWVVLGVSAAVFGISAIKNYHTKLWAWKLIALLFFFLAMILIKELLRVLGAYSPPQAQYAMGWIAAGVFLISLLRGGNTAVSRLARNVVFLAAVGIVIINVFVANVFFSLAQRGTQVDVIRANQMVASIRSHKDYPGEQEPLKLLALGTPKRLHESIHLLAMFVDWSANNLFKNYTDLNFVSMTDEEFLSIQPRLRKRADSIKAYPSPEFVYIDGRNVVLFLGDVADERAEQLGLTPEVERIVEQTRWIDQVYNEKNKYPIIARAGGFDLFIAQNALCYLNVAPAVEAQADQTFFHIVPEDAADLVEKQSRKKGFVGFADFSFADEKNQREEGDGEQTLFTCKPLPNYPVAMIRTGQYEPVGGMQKIRFILSDVNRRRKESKSIKEFAASLKQLAAEVKTSTLQYPWQRWSVTISGDALPPPPLY